MRIAIDLTSLADNFSGIERYALNIALELLRQDEKNQYDLIFKNQIFPSFDCYREAAYADRIFFHVLKGSNKLIFNQWTLPVYMRKMKADWYLFLAFPIPVMLHKKNMITTIHDLACWDCPGTMKKHMEWYFKLSHITQARKSRYILTISEFSKERIQKVLRVPDKKIRIIYCGLSENFLHPQKLDLEVIREKYHLPEDYLLCLSTLEPRKNMQLLLKVYESLYREGKIRRPLALAGRKGWKIEQMLTEIQEHGEIPVTVTGFIEDEDLPAIYKMAKCFVFPSIYEGFGIPPLEAMAMGVPVISSDSSCLPEILGDGAIYFRDQDEEDLKRKILELENGTIDIQEKKQQSMERCRTFVYAQEVKKLRETIDWQVHS